MKSQGKIILGALVAALVMAAPFAAHSRPGGHGYGPGPDCGYRQQAIPQEKRDAVYGMMREHQAKMQPLRDELWAKRTLLDALSRNQSADVGEIKALVNEISSLRAKVRMEHDAFTAQVKKDHGVDIPGGWCRMRGDGPGMHRGFGHGGGDGYGRRHGGGQW